MKKFLIVLAYALCVAVLALFAPAASAERIKDIASVQGVRPNQLTGYGLIVGLDGTGDQTTQTPFTVQSMVTMLGQLGVNLPPGTNLQLKNVAAVMVTAMLPAFARPGQMLDITVSSMGNAKSLRGGTLLMTPLKGADGQIYAMAQGNVAVGGAGAGAAGSKVQINHLNAGRVPGGATVERAVQSSFVAENGPLMLELSSGDFGTANRVAEAINAKFGPGTAQPVDGRVVAVNAPQSPTERVRFMAQLEELPVTSPVAAARVIINARTGSVAMNRAVTLEAVAIAHGNLSVTISTQPVVSQPGPFSQGQTVVAERADVKVAADKGEIIMLEGGARLADVVRALNVLGATPQDLLAILQALKSAGALRAELEII